MQQLTYELKLHLDLVPNLESEGYVIDHQESADVAMEQAEAFDSVAWSEEDIYFVFDLLYAIDILNQKYLTEYDLEAVSLDDLYGLWSSLDRCIGLISYGLEGELYRQFGGRQDLYPVLSALFGKRLGRFVLMYAMNTNKIYERIETYQEQAEADPDQFLSLVEDELDTLWQEQFQYATALGMPPETLRQVAEALMEDRLSGSPINLDAVIQELGLEFEDVILETEAVAIDEEEIEMAQPDAGPRVPMRSGLYISRSQLEGVAGQNRREKLRQALQQARDLDSQRNGARAGFNITSSNTEND